MVSFCTLKRYISKLPLVCCLAYTFSLSFQNALQSTYMHQHNMDEMQTVARASSQHIQQLLLSRHTQW